MKTNQIPLGPKSNDLRRKAVLQKRNVPMSRKLILTTLKLTFKGMNLLMPEGTVIVGTVPSLLPMQSKTVEVLMML